MCGLLRRVGGHRLRPYLSFFAIFRIVESVGRDAAKRAQRRSGHVEGSASLFRMPALQARNTRASWSRLLGCRWKRRRSLQSRVRWQRRKPGPFSFEDCTLFSTCDEKSVRAWSQPLAFRSSVYRRRRTLRVRCSGAGERAASLSGPDTRSCFSGGFERGVTPCGLGTRSFFSDGGERTATLRSTGTLSSFSGGGELCASALSAGARSLFSGGGARAIVISSGSVCWKRHR